MKSLTRAQVDGAGDKVIAWSAGGNDRKIKGNDYLQQFALPNFFFFVTTAYNILRHRGVPVGKRDFLGPVNWLQWHEADVRRTPDQCACPRLASPP